MVSDKLLRSFYLDRDLARGLKAASKGEYMSQGQMVRIALRTWLDTTGYLTKRPKGGRRTR